MKIIKVLFLRWCHLMYHLVIMLYEFKHKMIYIPHCAVNETEKLYMKFFPLFPVWTKFIKISCTCGKVFYET